MAFKWASLLCMTSIVLVSFGLKGAHSEERAPFFNQTPLQQTDNMTVLPPWERVLNFKSVPETRDEFSIIMWRKLVKSLKDEKPKDQIYKTNLWLNSFPYKQDNWTYGRRDHWSTPTEFLTRGGDCEDFAITKYITLRELGFAPEDLKISIVYDVFSGTDHAFLLVKHDGEEFVLDNRDNTIEASYYKGRYQPYYIFNEEQLTTFEKPVIASTIRGDDNLVLPGNR